MKEVLETGVFMSQMNLLARRSEERIWSVICASEVILIGRMLTVTRASKSQA